jgi:hypothetical protein
MTQLTFDDAAEPAQAKVTLYDVARDIYLDTCHHMGIRTQDEVLLRRLALRSMGKDGDVHDDPNPASGAANLLMLEILYGCDFLKDPDAVRDLYDDDSWILLLAQVGALVLIQANEMEWIESDRPG